MQKLLGNNLRSTDVELVRLYRPGNQDEPLQIFCDFSFHVVILMRYGFRIRCRPSPLYRICLPMDGGGRQALLVDGELREVDGSTSPRCFGSLTFQRCSRIHHSSFLQESSQFSLLIIFLASLRFINRKSNVHRSTTMHFLNTFIYQRYCEYFVI